MAYNQQNKLKTELKEKYQYNQKKIYNFDNLNVFTNDENIVQEKTNKVSVNKFNKYNYKNNSSIQNQLKLSQNYKVVKVKVQNKPYDPRQYTNISTLTNLQKMKLKKLESLNNSMIDSGEITNDFDDKKVTAVIEENINKAVLEFNNYNHNNIDGYNEHDAQIVKITKDKLISNIDTIKTVESELTNVEPKQVEFEIEKQDSPKDLFSIISKAKSLNSKHNQHNKLDVENLTIKQRIELRNLAMKNPDDPMYRKLLNYKLSLTGTMPNFRKEVEKRKKAILEKNQKLINKN